MEAILAAFLILVPAPVADGEPTGPAPTLQHLKYHKGAFETTSTVTAYETQAITVIENVNGILVPVTRTLAFPVVKLVKTMLDAKGAEVYGIDGKKIDESTWQKALGSGAVVVVVRDGNLPHAAYRKALREGTLIVVFKPMQPMEIPAPIPMPLPAPKQ
jgi:hypothetical protein